MMNYPAPFNAGGFNAVANPDDKICDLDQLGVLYEEFVARHSRHAEDEQWLKDFKAQVRQFSGDANVYRYRGRVVFTDDRNGRFSVKELESFDPDMVAQYTRIVAKEQFDEDAFRNDHPELWERLRAQRFLVK
jgi:hypothetical protein